MPIGNNIVNQKNAPAMLADVFVSFPGLTYPNRILINQSPPYGIFQQINGVLINIADTGAGTTGTLQTVTDNGSTTTNAITTLAYIKSGGLSTQFLKADGSIDSNTYITAAGAVTSITGTANQINASSPVGAVILSLPQDIATTSNVIFANISGAQGNFTGRVRSTVASGVVLINSGSATTGALYQQYVNSSGSLTMGVESSVGNAVFSAGVTPYATVIGNGVAMPMIFYTNNAGRYTISAAGNNSWTGAGVFASSVTASSIIKSGGLSTQFLKADGSIDSNTYITAAGAVTSVTGTLNQVNASSPTGAVTLSLPQSIATTSIVSFLRVIGNSGSDNGIDTIQSGGGSILANLFRFEGKNSGTTTIDATATRWNNNTGVNATYTLPTSAPLTGGLYMFSTFGGGTLTLSGTIIDKTGISVGNINLTTVNGISMFYFNGAVWYQLT
jgi:hypothetical protein